MSLAPRLDLRQSQSLVMTPQLQQAIRLLTLSNLEIEAFIADELEKNPLIETGSSEDIAPASDPGGDFDGEPAEPTDALSGLSGAGEDAPLDVDYVAETFHHDSAADMPGGGQGMDGSLGLAGAGSGGGEGGDLEATLADGTTLSDHLMAQAGVVLSGRDMLIAGHVIDALDEAGYLATSCLDLAD